MINWRKLAVVWLLGGAAVQAAPKELPPAPPPPMPQPQNVTIFRGRTVEIPLRAIGRAPSQLKFLIRTSPKHGRLGEIQFTSRKTAVVTYFHDEKSVATFDSFTYAVQAVDTAVSAPGTVNIVISDEPPALSVIHTLDFGRAWVGEKRSEELVLRNTGGGTLSGRMVVSEPWKVLGSPEYRLGRKEEKKIRLLFAPSEAGEFAARLLFSHDPRSSVTLSGGAQAPLEFDPAGPIVLATEAGGNARAARFTIRNRTEAERVVEISLPEHVQGPEEVSVPANGETAVDLRVKAEFLSALDDRIDLESDGFLRSLPLQVPAVPALLRAEPASGLDFGELGIKSPERRTLTLRNEGGVPARLRVETPPEIRLVPEPNAVLLAPGEKRTFEVELELAGEGDFRKDVALGGSGTGPGIAFPVRARGIVSRPSGGGSQGEVRPETSPILPAAARPVAARGETFSDIPAVQKIATKSLSRKAIEFRWKKPAPNAVSTLLEYRSLENDAKGRVVTRWNKWQGAAFREDDGDTVALLDNLPPGRSWYLRVVTLDEIGRRSPPSETIRLNTPNAPSWAWLWWTAGIAVAGLGGYGVVLLRRQREAEARADADRLSKLSR